MKGPCRKVNWGTISMSWNHQTHLGVSDSPIFMFVPADATVSLCVAPEQEISIRGTLVILKLLSDCVPMQALKQFS